MEREHFHIQWIYQHPNSQPIMKKNTGIIYHKMRMKAHIQV